MPPLEWILKEKLVAILRGVNPHDMNRIVEALYAGGIRVLEITLNTDSATELIAGLSATYKHRMLIGAGTVIDVDGAERAHRSGAAFLISPGFDADVVRYAKQHSLVSIPGAFTATEIMTAHKAGADIVKIFPVNNAEYIRNVSAPLNHVRMMPTGGINTTNIHEFSKAGAVAFGVGSALVSKATSVNASYLAEITRKAEELVAAVSKF
jgi:2-dehydro-3-deoxyphosphogluconate aldolase/(4S)-4-hydroxy-2-oxoglutarate aldolase